MHKGMVKVHYGLRRGVDDHMFVGHDGHPGAELKNRIEVVCHHHDGEIELMVQALQQRAKRVGTVRIQTGSGLVEQQQGRVHGQCARRPPA